jgi:hypothetical protein
MLARRCVRGLPPTSRLHPGLQDPVWQGACLLPQNQSAMTSRQRVLAAMRRQQPDRTPVHLRGVRAWDSDWVARQDCSYRPVIEAVLEHCDLIPDAGVAGIDSPFLSAATQEITETCTIEAGDWTIRHTVIHTPKGDLRQDSWHALFRGAMVRRHFIETPEDVERVLSVPYVAPQIDLTRYLWLRDQFPDNLVILMCPQAASAVWELLGTASFAYFWSDHRDLLYQLRDAFQERALGVLDSVLAAGAGPVVGTDGVETVAPPIHSPQAYRDFALPTFREYSARIHARGCLLHVHCHNRLNALLEDVAEVGWDCAHPVEPPPLGGVDLADAKRRVGTRMCIEGNLQIGEIYAAPTDHLVELAEEAIAAGKPGGGFILCPTASPHTRPSAASRSPTTLP